MYSIICRVHKIFCLIIHCEWFLKQLRTTASDIRIKLKSQYQCFAKSAYKLFYCEKELIILHKVTTCENDSRANVNPCKSVDPRKSDARCKSIARAFLTPTRILYIVIYPRYVNLIHIFRCSV